MLEGQRHTAVLWKTPLTADIAEVRLEKKEAPRAARIPTIIACQTGQDLNRMLENPVQKWAGCLRTPRTPLGPATGGHRAQKYP